MTSFPTLKTAAVIQYPATRSVQHSNQVIRFLDGSEQRYRAFGPPLRRWNIRLELLDESELAALEAFFTANQGSYGSFSFVDPWDGVEYPDCSLEQDHFELQLAGEMRGTTSLTVKENRI